MSWVMASAYEGVNSSMANDFQYTLNLQNEVNIELQNYQANNELATGEDLFNKAQQLIAARPMLARTLPMKNGLAEVQRKMQAGEFGTPPDKTAVGFALAKVFKVFESSREALNSATESATSKWNDAKGKQIEKSIFPLGQN